MIRPELTAMFQKYREVIAATAFALAGLWAMTWGGWFWQGVGAIVLLIGAALAYTALRRMRFATDEIGPGVVEIDERQISYFSAYEGGVVSINQLARISIIGNQGGQWGDTKHWLLEEDGGTLLTIPASASGADKLVDAFTALDGLNLDRASAALNSAGAAPQVIWQKPRTALH
ncbi:MAG: hypothetical protein OXC60_12890 [Litoreibacter sp.]|nr:hypothetical protein [Litoreibacter sp.]